MPDKDNDNPKSSNDESVDRQKLGARLREAREYLGLSQDEVAKYLSIREQRYRISKAASAA